MRLASLLLAALVAACSSSSNDAADPPDAGGGATSGPKDQSIDAAKECDRRLTCNQTTETRERCILGLNAVRVTAACKVKVDSATCATTLEDIDRACFPACTGSTSTCGPDDTITTCSERGFTFTFACQGVCELVKRKTSNSCGVADGGTDLTCGCQ